VPPGYQARGFSFASGCALIAPMDEDLANIIRTALDEAKTAGRDDSSQTEYAMRKVLGLLPDMTDTDARNAINLVRSFL